MWYVYYKKNDIKFVETYEECEMYLETAEMDKYQDLLDEAMRMANRSYSMKKCD